MKIFSFLAVFVLSIGVAIGQYTSPVDFPISLSGNVGEIRSTHFHSGIDIKSPGGIGAKVRSVADGYVERVFVSSAGYGKAVYIRHFDGTVSVYGHLDKFEASIADWVKGQQMAKRSFRLDAYPDRTMFAVKQGEVVGYLGNSGSSGGPHLHLEIRNTAGEPLNVQARNFFTIKDDVAPKIYKIIIVECDTVNGAPIFRAGSSVEFKNGVPISGKTLTASGLFYIAYDLIDLASDSDNTIGIYSLTQSIDGRPNFGFKIDKTSYTNGKYVNALLEWSTKPQGRSSVVRAYVSPNNKLGIYSSVVNRGILAAPREGQPMQVTTTIADNNGNISRVSFNIIGGGSRAMAMVDGDKVEWNKEFSTTGNNFRLTIAAGSLYETTLISSKSDGQVVEVGNSRIPLQKSFALAIKSALDFNLQSKALIVNERGKSVGGSYKDGYVVANIGSFGRFSVSYDNTPPTIVHNGVRGGKVSFKVSDNLSGVKSYDLKIDGRWAIGDYDAKTGNIVSEISYNKATKPHDVMLTVVDGKGNSNSFQTIEQW